MLHGGGGGQRTQIRSTALTRQLAKSQPGLLVAAMVALHENNKVQLEQAGHIFKVCHQLLLIRSYEARSPIILLICHITRQDYLKQGVLISPF